MAEPTRDPQPPLPPAAADKAKAVTYQTFKCMDCGTGHVTRADDERLAKDAADKSPGRVVHAFDGGYFVYCWLDRVNQEDFNSASRPWIDAGYSAAFMILLMKAANAGCKFLCLDRDGPSYQDLSHFKW